MSDPAGDGSPFSPTTAAAIALAAEVEASGFGFDDKTALYYGTNHFLLLRAHDGEGAKLFKEYAEKKVPHRPFNHALEERRGPFLDHLFGLMRTRGDEKGLAARYRELREEAIQLGLVPTATDVDPAALHKAKADAARVKGLQVAKDVVAALKRSGALGVRTSGTVTTLFDLGCGDGGTTGPLAAALGVPREKCLGLDYEFGFDPQNPNLSMGALVSDAFCFALYTDQNPAPAKPCTFDIRFPFPPVEQARGGGGGGAGGAAAAGEAVDFDNELLGEANPHTPNYPKHVRNDAFDLITTLHVLHHIPAASRGVVLTEVARTLKKGGLFLVKEHDVPDESFAHFLDAVHVYKQKIVYPGGEEQDMPFTKFQSRAEWIQIIEANGLVHIHSEYEPDAYLRDIFMVFKKL